ncbi:AIPR family protein [Glycomyces sp. MUSA5-2]|uniref:AIPR family protein n=1 Tax=Glycomyces sp. MUSA5-2 TaxID=2053002 RepID=UPI00300A2DE2
MENRFTTNLSNALKNEFLGRIDLNDVSDSDPDQSEFHTRALSAMVVRYLIDCPSKRAVDYVTKGADDHDIHAVAYDERQNRLWLIQTRWNPSDAETGSEEDFGGFTTGVVHILKARHEKFNNRYRHHEVAIESIMNNDPEITLVIALASSTYGHPEHWQALEDCADEVGRWYTHRAKVEVLTLDKLVRIARADMGEPPIDLDVTFAELGTDTEDLPHRIYFGTVSATEVARWYSDHQERLFRRNIRGALGRTTVNQSIRTTLIERPEHFWNFNNGITMIARSGSIGMNRSGVLNDVAIVNGAQTVSSIAETVKEHPQAGRAKVLMKVSIIGDNDELTREITGAANTQNRVDIRDLASLYEQQDDLKQEFFTALGKEYTTRHTEVAPADDNGCTSEEALIALACGHADHRYAVQAKTLPDVLWDRNAGGAYRNLFRSGITAEEIWRHVQLMRSVLSTIRTARKKYTGRAAQIVDHGELLTVHVVARQFAHRIDDEAWEETVLDRVTSAAGDTLKRIITLFPNGHPSSVAKDEQKTRDLVAKVLADIASGAAVPELPDEFVKGRSGRKSRTPNLVPQIVRHGVIKEGTMLEFRPVTREHRQLFQRWITTDPRRSRATWVNDSKAQLRWEVDGKAYSASRLALILINSLGDKRYKAIRGSECWYVTGLGSLKDIGLRLHDEADGAGDVDVEDSGLF